MKKFSQNPLVLIASIVGGILFGAYIPNATAFLTPINDIYTSLLQVTSVPVIIAAITVSVKKITQKEFRGTLKKWVWVSLATALLAATIGIGTSVSLADFLAPSDKAMVSLTTAKNAINNQEISDSFAELAIYASNNISNDNTFSFVDFLITMVPQNIFESLSDNSTLQIFIFFIILGIMLNFIDDKHSEYIIDLLNGILMALSHFIDILLLFLPISVFIAMTTLFANSNTISILDSIVDFIIVNYIAMLVLITVSCIIICLCTKTSFMTHLRAMKRTFFVSIGTNTRTAVIPFTIEDSVENMHSDKTTLNSLLPIGSFLLPNGTILSSTILAVYSLIIYEQPFAINTLTIVAVGAILFSMSKSGGANTAAILTMMLQPLAIPSEIMLIILMAASQFYSGFSTFTDVYSNLAIATMVSPKKE